VSTQPLSLTVTTDCWNRIGVLGDRSCPELATVQHCHNCPVFTTAGRQFLDKPSPGGYLDEWTERLALPLEDEAANLESILVFRLGEEWLGLPARVLVEVTIPRPLHRIPHRGGLLSGLVNIRGELHLCVRLDLVLGLGGGDADAGGAGGEAGPHSVGRLPRFLVVKRDGEAWVFPVDEVDQVHRFPAAKAARVPATVSRSLNRLTRGVFASEGRSVGCLDDARLFQVLRTKIR
jgi:chemotaxis-related protein WspD